MTENLCTSSLQAPNLNLAAFIQSVQNLSDEMDIAEEDKVARERRLAESKVEKQKADALLEGLQGLFGLKMGKVEHTDSHGIKLSVEVENEQFLLELDEERRLSRISEPANNVEKSVQITQILEEAQKLEPPNDIRYALFQLSSAMRFGKVLREHIAESRKKYIISQVDSHSLLVSFKAGYEANIQLHTNYPNVPSGVLVRSLRCSLSAVQGNDGVAEKLLKLTGIANTKGFRTIADLCSFLEATF